MRANFVAARRLMARNGNPNQWGRIYPLDEWVVEDVRLGRAVLLVDHEGRECGERVLAQFTVCTGVEPAYGHIEGEWLDDDPYVTVHRLVSTGLKPHSASACLEWVLSRYGNVRADTDPHNTAMLHVLEKAGFTRCGLINLDRTEGDTVRIGFQRHVSVKEWKHDA